MGLSYKVMRTDTSEQLPFYLMKDVPSFINTVQVTQLDDNLRKK